MAFTPNTRGQLLTSNGFDLRGQPLLSSPRDCLCAIVNAKRQQEKTSVRADSSASRGMADEITTGLGRILFPKYENVNIGDIFIFDGDSYDIKSKHVRRDVLGRVDHIECDIEVRPR